MCLQGKDGTYGTSLRYGVAMDPGCDVMVCFMQNGRLLQPDHGFPVRFAAVLRTGSYLRSARPPRKVQQVKRGSGCGL